MTFKSLRRKCDDSDWGQSSQSSQYFGFTCVWYCQWQVALSVWYLRELFKGNYLNFHIVQVQIKWMKTLAMEYAWPNMHAEWKARGWMYFNESSILGSHYEILSQTDCHHCLNSICLFCHLTSSQLWIFKNSFLLHSILFNRNDLCFVSHDQMWNWLQSPIII